MKPTILSAMFTVSLALGCQKSPSSEPHPDDRQSDPDVASPAASSVGLNETIKRKANLSQALSERWTACPTGKLGQAMVEFQTAGGRRYCMDRTEVTQAEYSDFLEARVGADTQTHPLCNVGKNPDFSPRRDEVPCGVRDNGAESAMCVDGVFDPVARGDEPMVCIDFCDAVAYCAWAGKRLCGVPGDAARTLGDGFDSASKFRGALTREASHFYNACTRGSSSPRAYAAGFDINRCAGARRVSSRAECTTAGKNGAVFDLVGGVGEWQDSCTDAGECRVLGGMFGVGAERGDCGRDTTMPNGSANPATGFRCCADLAAAEPPRGGGT